MLELIFIIVLISGALIALIYFKYIIKKELVLFGNYLLTRREKNEISEQAYFSVTDSDINNYLEE